MKIMSSVNKKIKIYQITFDRIKYVFNIIVRYATFNIM